MSQKPLGGNAERVRRLVMADPDLTVREIAQALGLTTQRVYQLINTLQIRGELEIPEESEEGS